MENETPTSGDEDNLSLQRRDVSVRVEVDEAREWGHLANPATVHKLWKKAGLGQRLLCISAPLYTWQKPQC